MKRPRPDSFYHPDSTKMSISVATICTLVVLCFTRPVSANGQSLEEQRRYKLALSYESNGDYENAARVYAELATLDPDAQAYFDGLERSYRTLGKFNDLMPYVEERIKRFPGRYQLRMTYAELLFMNGRTNEAEDAWARAFEDAPKVPESYFEMADSFIRVREFDRGLNIYKMATTQFGRSEPISDRSARLYLLVGNYGAAAREYIDMLTWNPALLSNVLAGLSLITSTPTGLQQTLDVATQYADLYARQEPFLKVLEWIYTEQGNDSRALEIVAELDRTVGRNGSSLYSFADRMVQQGHYEAALKGLDMFLKEYDRTNPLTPSVMYVYVNALRGTAEGDGTLTTEEAEDLISRYSEVAQYGKGGTLGAQASLNIARLQWESLGAVDEAVATLESVLGNERTSKVVAEARLYLADLRIARGNMDEAEELLNSLIADIGSNRNLTGIRDRARLRLAEAELFSNHWNRAEEILGEITDDITSDAANDALEWSFILQENGRRYASALRSYVAGVYFQRRQMPDSTSDRMQRVFELSPESPLADDALYAAAVALQQLGRPEEALILLDTLVASYPDGTHAADGILLAGTMLEAAGKREEAIATLTKILVDYPRSSAIPEAREKIRRIRGDKS